MKKQFLFLGMAAVMMASCTTDDFVGENQNASQNEMVPIVFSSEAPNMTRAEGTEAAATLKYNFTVLGTKTKGSPAVTTNVFAHTKYNASGIEDANLYDVWYNTNTNGTTTSNTSGWEYVGVAGEKTTPGDKFDLAKEQTIKYWDQSATYDFIAYANTGGIESGNIKNVTTTGFNITDATADQLAGLYVADRMTAVSPKTDGAAVKFNFRSSAAKVRLGIYETIPGYKITSITFHYNNEGAQESKTNAYLAGKFIGSASGKISAIVSFDSDNKAQITTATSGDKTTYFDFGKFTVDNTKVMGTTSIVPTWAVESDDVTAGSFTHIIPNMDEANVGDMTLTVDYTLTSEKDNSGETIEVKGATAVVPAAYMTWKPNFAYTYLFKISDNTNGSTGGSTVGLYPITFDAATITDLTDQGTTTVVSTPSITTSQAGSDGTSYVAGEIDVMVMNATTALTLDNSKLNVYEVTVATEAELGLLDDTEWSALTSTTVSFDSAGTKATFTAEAGKKYAIVFIDDSNKTYKLVEVAAAP